MTMVQLHTHELRKYYGRITDGNNSVLHYFYDYVYAIIRYATFTFFGPYRIVKPGARWPAWFLEITLI